MSLRFWLLPSHPGARSLSPEVKKILKDLLREEAFLDSPGSRNELCLLEVGDNGISSTIFRCRRAEGFQGTLIGQVIAWLVGNPSEGYIPLLPSGWKSYQSEEETWGVEGFTGPYLCPVDGEWKIKEGGSKTTSGFVTIIPKMIVTAALEGEH